MVVQLTDGRSAEPGPCPDWCLGDHGFRQGTPVHPDDGFIHVGPDASVALKWRALLDGPPDTVRVRLESHTTTLHADPGPPRIEMHVRTTEGEAFPELSPAEARALAASLLMLADVAQRASQPAEV